MVFFPTQSKKYQDNLPLKNIRSLPACLLIPLNPDPGSGISFYRITYLGSRITNPYFWELSNNFLSVPFCSKTK
jgi:hypothetical protein